MNTLASMLDNRLLMALAAGFVFLLLMWPQAQAQERRLSDGIAAYEAGDFGRAKAMLQPLAEAGSAEAQFFMGEMYYEGQSVDRDYSIAIAWFTKAGKQGHARALGSLGYMANNGVGTSKDAEKALCLYIDAARRGYANAQWNLARYYWERSQWERYEYWLSRAEKQGHPFALLRRARVWLLNPLELNKTKAYLYLMVAARKGEEAAIQRLEEIRESPSLVAVEQLQHAEQLLPEWRETKEVPAANLTPISDDCYPSAK